MGKSKKQKKKSKAAQKAAAEEAKMLEMEENERRAAEAMAKGMKVLGTTENSDLFAPIPPTADCAICMVPLPIDERDVSYSPCCGMSICCACADGHEAAQEEVNADRKTKKQPPLPLSCEFCRAPIEKSKEDFFTQYEKRIEIGDTQAMTNLAGRYSNEPDVWVGKDETKGFDLILRAVELGDPKAFNRLACFYNGGEHVAASKTNGLVCLQAAARGGYYGAHLNLGGMAYNSGNMQLALKHYRFAASSGYKGAVDEVRKMYDNGLVSHNEFTGVLRDYQVAFMEQRSDERTKRRSQKLKKHNN